jgi:hypothetical protein
MPWTCGMTTPTGPQPATRLRVRDLLVEQQRSANADLPLPALLRTPSIALLWMLSLSTVVAAMTLGHVRVPRVARGVVVVEHHARDGLTPRLLLPASTRPFVQPSQLVAIDTGGGPPLVLRTGPRMLARADRETVSVALEPCRGGHCLPYSTNQRFTATATLGTRSLASFAFPQP